MNRKPILTAIVVSALIVSMLSGTQFFYLAKANPVPNYYDHPNPTAPPAHLPMITIENPQNMTYNSNSVLLEITASISPLDNKAEITSIAYSLDGTETTVLNSTYTLGPTTYTWHTTLNLTQGTHAIQFTASARSYYLGMNGADFKGHLATYSPIVRGFSDNIFFTVASSSDSSSQSIEPSPSATPSPSPTASPTLTPTLEPTLEPTSTTAIHETSTNIIPYVIIVFVIVVIWIILLIYQKRKWNRIKKLREES